MEENYSNEGLSFSSHDEDEYEDEYGEYDEYDDKYNYHDK